MLTAPVALVISLPYISPTIRYRAYLEKVGGVSVIEWQLRRLRTQFPEAPVFVMYSEGPDSDAVAAFSGLCQPFRQPLHGTVSGLASLAEEHNVGTVVLLRPASAFAPSGLVASALGFHVTGGYNCTAVTGMPADVPPEIYSASVLNTLVNAGISGEPGAGIERLRHTGADAELRRGFFDASHLAPMDIRLPDAIQLSFAEHYSVARDAILAGEENLLANWRILSTRAYRKPRLQASPRSLARRILFLSNASGCSGAELVMTSVIREIDQSRFECYAAVALEGWFTERLREAGCTVVCPNSDFSQSSVPNIEYAFHLCREIEPAIIHSNGRNGTAFAAAAQTLGIPYVQHLHVGQMAGFEMTLPWSAAAIAVSRLVLREAKASVPGVSCTVIYNGVNLAEFSPEHHNRERERQRLGIPPDSFVVCTPARMVPEKRHDILLRAVAAAGTDVFAVCAGDSNRDEQTLRHIREIAAALRVDARLRLLPHQPSVAPLLAASDMVALPSSDEPFGNAAIEAMSMRLPVAVSSAAGVAEIVRNGRNGFVFRDGDPAELAQIIRVLRTDPSVRFRISALGQRYVRRYFNSAAHARYVTGLYDAILDQRPTGT